MVADPKGVTSSQHGTRSIRNGGTDDIVNSAVLFPNGPRQRVSLRRLGLRAADDCVNFNFELQENSPPPTTDAAGGGTRSAGQPGGSAPWRGTTGGCWQASRRRGRSCTRN